MELQDIKEKLESIDGGTELMEGIISLVNAEKEKGISLHNKVNAEAKNLRKFKQQFEALGYDGSDDVDNFTATLINKISKPETDAESKLTLKSLSQQIKNLEGTLQKERERANQYQTIAKHKTITNKLADSLSNKVYGHDLLIKDLISEGKVDLVNDEIVFVENDTHIDFNTGISNLLEARKDIVKNSQVPGSNTRQPNSLVEPNINNVLQSKDKETIKANLGSIKSFLNMK